MYTVKGDNSGLKVFVSFQAGGQLLQERICSQREQILSFKSNPYWRGFTCMWSKYKQSSLKVVSLGRMATKQCMVVYLSTLIVVLKLNVIIEVPRKATCILTMTMTNYGCHSSNISL